MKYPIGIQSYESLRRDDYVYVDKTALIYQLVTTGRYYFLSRPRRFGKSLLISTLQAYFEGKRELFEGLAIADLEKVWTARPVLYLDMNTGKYQEKDSLEKVLEEQLIRWEEKYGTGRGESTQELRFKGIVQRACEQTGHRVAILVDEYDKPLLQTFDKPELQEDYRNTLKAFYSVCKTQDRYIKLAFFTGVTKFSKVSVFSDLNNLKDISMDMRFVNLCGITDGELHACFDEPVEQLAAACDITKEECYAKLRLQYDGYHFHEKAEGLYNPFSLLNTLDRLEFRNYWFETGTPTFLVEVLKKNHYQLDNLTEELATADDLTGLDTAMENPVPLIYQSGYLTIKGYEKEFKMYKLGYPNKEVEEGFAHFLMPFYTPVTRDRQNFFIPNFVKDLRTGNVEGFMTRLQALFADGSYQVVGDMELYFQNCMAVIMKLLGFYVDVERHTSNGRIDIVVKTQDYIYVMELKLDDTVEAALRQIEEKGYALPYAADSRTLYKIGISFSTKTRRLEDWRAVR